MSGILADIPMAILLGACVVTLLAGFVKGAVGFAMPMIMISGLSTFMPGEAALAALILPTLVTNGLQALRCGWREAWAAMREFRVFLVVCLVFLACSAQLVRILPRDMFFMVIGFPVVVFAVLQLAGFQLRLRAENRTRDEVIIGGFAGFIGGMSGIWGPPTVAYLTAIGADKSKQMQVQGVIYGLGAVALLLAHIKSGVFNAATAPLSVLMLAPAMVGMWIGYQVHERLPQATFRKATLIVLAVVGLNLVRRGLLG